MENKNYYLLAIISIIIGLIFGSLWNLIYLFPSDNMLELVFLSKIYLLYPVLVSIGVSLTILLKKKSDDKIYEFLSIILSFIVIIISRIIANTSMLAFSIRHESGCCNKITLEELYKYFEFFSYHDGIPSFIFFLSLSLILSWLIAKKKRFTL